MVRGTKAKLLRIAAGKPKPPAEYEKPELHHLAAMPTYEKYTRLMRSMWRGAIRAAPVEKIRYRSDGKTPLKALLDDKGRPLTELIPIAKPHRLKAGSPRRVYQMLKRIERKIGMDQVFNQLQKEAA